MITFETEVLAIIKRTAGIKSFHFKTNPQANFKPGQFFMLTIRINGQEVTKHFSFSNSPTETDYIEFTKRLTDSAYSQALDKLKVGDWARIKMPLGSFTFEGEQPKTAFLSGGIGITPIRSIWKAALDNKLSGEMILLYSNRTKDDIAFKQDFDQMAGANQKMRVIYTITDAQAGESWPGRVGRIDSNMIKQEIPDYRQRVFYVCGPPKMVEALTSVLKSGLGIAENKIRTENFAGY